MTAWRLVEDINFSEIIASVIKKQLLHIISHFLSPQAVGLGLDYVQLGGLSGAETMAKYNRLILIEEELARQGLLGRCFSCSLILAGQRGRRSTKQEKDR